MNLLVLNKRGDEWGLKQVLEIILAIMIILILIFAATRLFETYFGKQKEMQAKGTLDRITKILNSLAEAETESYLLQTPNNWHIVAFDAQHSQNKEYVKSSKYFQQNVLCICEKKDCKICQTIKMPLKKDNELAIIKIEPSEIWLTNMKDHYEISKTKPTIAMALTEEEKTEIQLQMQQTNQIIVKDYETIIADTVKKYYPQVKDYIANEKKFKKLITAIITIESRGSWNAIGTSGEVGLMQLMPQIAMALELKIYDPENKITNAQNKWSDEILNYLKTEYVSNLRELKNTKTKAELILLDERFDEAKNIDTGTKHLVSLITQLKDWELGVMAYNTGMGSEATNTGVLGNCKPPQLIYCRSEFVGLKYLQKVKTAMTIENS